MSQLVGHKIKFLQSIHDKTDPGTVSKVVSDGVEKAWKDIDMRLTLVPGKDFIAELSTTLMKQKGFSITTTMLIDGISKDEIPDDLARVIEELDRFCKR